MPKKRRIKAGSLVYYQGQHRTIYAIYKTGYVSLCMIGYPDVEEDFQVAIADLVLSKTHLK